MKFGASVPLYNREWYIGPFLEQMIEVGVKPVVALSEIPFANEGKDEPKEPDRSEEIVRRFFPEVEIVKGRFSHHRDSMRAGIERLKDHEIVFVNDCDIFMTTEDWRKLFKFIEENFQNSDVFSYDFMTIGREYYHDYRFGTGVRPGGYPPIMGLKPNIGINTMVATDGGRHLTWDDLTATVHHLRFCKGKYGGGDLYEKAPESNLHNYTVAPDEIVNRFKKWEKIIETI